MRHRLTLTVVPYQEPVAKDSAELASTLSSTMPMAAMFTRNKFVGWYDRINTYKAIETNTNICRAGVVFAIQSWLGESSDVRKKSSTPGYFGVFLARESLPPIWQSLL